MKSPYLIPQNPVLTLADLWREPRANLPDPLNRSAVTLFGYARGALYVGLKRLGIRPGDNILLPSFICNVVMAPLNQLGVEGRFYDSDRYLRPVFSSAKAKIDRRTRAFLAVNYFGFPQDMALLRSFCEENRLYFIEDSAHCFLSCVGSQPLGTFGDIGIISFRKTLPLPNGAALIVNNQNIPEGQNQIEGAPVSAPNSTIKFALRHSLRNIERCAHRSLMRPLKQALRYRSTINGTEPDEETTLGQFNPPVSALTKFLLRRFDVDQVRKHRRIAFDFWKEEIARRFQGVIPIFTEIAEGVAPFALPLLAADYLTLKRNLNELGVECIAWPDRLPRCSLGWNYANRVILVPLHWLPHSKAISADLKATKDLDTF